MNDKSKHRYNGNPALLCAKGEGFGWGRGAQSTPADGEKAAGENPSRGRKGVRRRVARRRWLSAWSSGRWFRLTDKRNSGIPSDRTTSVHAAPKSHRGATSDGPQTEVQPPHRGLPSQRLGTPRPPAPPWDWGVSFEGGGVPHVLANPCRGVASGSRPALRPLPAHRSRPRPALGGARGSAASRVPAWKVRGWVRSAPRPQPPSFRPKREPGCRRSRPRLPRPQPPPWPPRNLSLRHLLRGAAAVASAPGTPAAASGSARPGARSQLRILRSAPGSCQLQLRRQPGRALPAPTGQPPPPPPGQ